MFRALKTGYAGYTHMSPVARLSLKLKPAKLFLGFTQAHIAQSNLFTKIMKDFAEEGITALKTGKYGAASSAFRSLVIAQTMAIGFGGAAGVFKQVSEAMRAFGDIDTAEKMDETAERAAFIGNLPKLMGLPGLRFLKMTPDGPWYFDANSNMIGSSIQSAKKAMDPELSQEMRNQGGIEALQQFGIGNLGDTISLANMHRIYTTYRKAADTGYIVHHTYSPGKLWGGIQESKPIGVIAEEAKSDPNAPEDIQKMERGAYAVIKMLSLPTEEFARAQREQIDSWEAEERIKGISEAAHAALNRQMNRLHKMSHKMGVRAQGSRKLDPNDSEQASVKEAVAVTRENAMPYKEGTRGGFWVTQLKLIQKDPKYLESLKAQGQAIFRHEILTGSYR